MDKMYTIAGTSLLDGKLTWRFANGSLSQRETTLKRRGHGAVVLMELPRPMTVDKAIAYLKRRGMQAEIPRRGRRPANETRQ
jgi:hypothetical protein